MSYAGIFPAQNYDGPINWVNGPCTIHLYAIFKILMGHWKNWWAIWKNWWAQESLIPLLEQNKHQIWIAYMRGPSKNQIRFDLSLMVFSQRESGLSQEYPCITCLRCERICFLSKKGNTYNFPSVSLKAINDYPTNMTDTCTVNEFSTFWCY